MNKKTQMLIGVAAVGVAAYLLWEKSQKPKSFMNLVSKRFGVIGQTASGQILFSGPRGIITLPQGVVPFTSSNGEFMACIEGDCIYLTGPSAVSQTQITSL
jgi:hypothetical protein